MPGVHDFYIFNQKLIIRTLIKNFKLMHWIFEVRLKLQNKVVNDVIL